MKTPRQDSEMTVPDAIASQLESRFNETTIRRIVILAIVFFLLLVYLAFRWTYGAP